MGGLHDRVHRPAEPFFRAGAGPDCPALRTGLRRHSAGRNTTSESGSDGGCAHRSPIACAEPSSRSPGRPAGLIFRAATAIRCPVRPRVGRGIFRTVVADVYGRRCAVNARERVSGANRRRPRLDYFVCRERRTVSFDLRRGLHQGISVAKSAYAVRNLATKSFLSATVR